MKKYINLLVCFAFVSWAQAREITPKWRDAIEIKELAKARQKAEAEKKFVTIIVSNKSYDSESQGAQQTVDVIEDTIKALKTSSIIVRSTVDEVRGLKQGDEFNIAVAEGFKLAGNGLPMIIVLNSAEKKLVEVINPNDVYQKGSKAFRDLKKKARELKK